MIVLLFSLFASEDLEVDEIVKKAQDTLHLPQHRTEILLVVQKKRRVKEYELTLFQDDSGNVGSAEFHRPLRDKGTKYLRKDGGLWMFLPSIEKTKRIAGHMLNQGVMGSDLSYEEMLVQQDWTTNYEAQLNQDTIEQESPCFHVTLRAKDPKNFYAKRVLWIEKEHFVPIREQVYDSSDNLVKEWVRKDLRYIGTQWIPFYQEIENKRIPTNKTTITVTEIKLEPTLSQDFFSHRWLER